MIQLEHSQFSLWHSSDSTAANSAALGKLIFLTTLPQYPTAVEIFRTGPAAGDLCAAKVPYFPLWSTIC